LEYVNQHEISQIKTLFQTVYPENQLPKFLFVVVSKRINTRIFGVSQQGPNKRLRQNPPPGTVVDDVITLPER
jgi:aubergine-like protein